MNKLFRSFATALSMLALVSLASAAPVYNAATKTARMQVVVTQVDGGGAAGSLVIGTSGMATTLCTLTLNYNPAGTVSGSVLTLSGFPKSCTASASGTAAAASVKNSSGTDVITGLTVGTSGSDINLNSTSVSSGQTVTINSMTFTHY